MSLAHVYFMKALCGIAAELLKLTNSSKVLSRKEEYKGSVLAVPGFIDRCHGKIERLCFNLHHDLELVTATWQV